MSRTEEKRMDDWNDDVITVQRRVAKLGGKIPFTKRNLCDAVAWFRDKYHLSDRDALDIARGKMSFEETRNAILHENGATSDEVM